MKSTPAGAAVRSLLVTVAEFRLWIQFQWLQNLAPADMRLVDHASSEGA